MKFPDKNATGFAIFQVHCYHFNVTLYLDNTQQNGTDLGFVVFKEQKFHLFNFHLNPVKCLIAFITYDNDAPTPGACNSLAVQPTISVKLNQFVETSLIRAGSMKSDNSSCNSERDDLIYESFYLYLNQDDFDPDAYFDGIKKMIFGDLSQFGIKVRFIRTLGVLQFTFWSILTFFEIQIMSEALFRFFFRIFLSFFKLF